MKLKNKKGKHESSYMTVRKTKVNNIKILNEDVAEIEVIRKNGTVLEFLIDREDIPKIEMERWYYHEGYCSRSPGNGRVGI